MKDEQKEEMFQFLSGTFHQDVESPETALKEYIQDSTKEGLKQDTLLLETFLKWDASLESKNKFIEDHTWIDFSEMNLEPVDWLENVVRSIRGRL